jgi:hypothetical protein
METMKVFNFQISGLTNEEFLQFANDISVVVGKSNVSDLGLTGVYNLFEASLAEANNFIKDNRKHPLSAEIDAARNLRDLKVSSVLTLTKGYKIAPVDSIKQAVEIAVPALEVFIVGFSKTNNFVKSQRLKLLFSKMDADNNFTTALQTIGLKTFLDELRENETTLKTLVEDRRASQPERNNEGNSKVFTNAAARLRIMLNAIDTYALVEKSKDFRPLITEMNATIGEYKKLVELRKSLKKQQLAKNATAPAAATTGTVQNEVA